MPSTYSPSLRLELQATGENANTWGTKTNNNLELIEQAVAGYVKITLTSASATYPLVIADASASDGRNAYIEFVGTVASAISITVPDVEKGYWVRNSATGSPLTFRTSSGTGVVLPTNQWVNLVSDGASITSTFPTSITGYALLSATQTFTGANTFTSAVNIQSNLSVTGNAFVSGVTTLASSVDIKGATSLASTLLVNGNAVFNSNVSVSGIFQTSGVATFSSAVDIKGAVSAASTLVVNGNATFNSNVSVSGTFLVSGVATLASAVDIKGATSLASTLVVNGNATFNSKVSVSGVMVVGAGAVGAPSYSTTGDTNTGLYFPAADTIAVATSGTERMRVTSSGNVGIGTSSPDYLLTIQSAGDAQLSLKNSSGTTKAYIGTAGIFGGVSTDDLRIRSEATNIVFGFSGAEKMRITSNGDVGIGTSSPTASVPLTILANSGNAIAQNIRGEATGIGVLLFSDNSDVENGRLDFRTNYAEIKQARNAPLVFSTNATERMRITSSGTVGIGTSSPNSNAVLTVNGNIAVAAPTRNQATSNQLGVWTSDDPADNGRATITIATVAGGSSSSSYIAFTTNNYGVDRNERMRIDSAGNVRIGTAALATTATDGFLYVPTCAGTPTGTPTAITGLAPIVVNTTNNKLYFYSGGAWRDAGP